MDWFISAQSKSTILNILFIIKDILAAKPDKEPTRSEFNEKLEMLREINSNFPLELDDWEWPKIRNITKAMWCKYKKEKENDKLKKYNNFVQLARSYWKLQFEK